MTLSWTTSYNNITKILRVLLPILCFIAYVVITCRWFIFIRPSPTKRKDDDEESPPPTSETTSSKNHHHLYHRNRNRIKFCSVCLAGFELAVNVAVMVEAITHNNNIIIRQQQQQDRDGHYHPLDAEMPALLAALLSLIWMLIMDAFTVQKLRRDPECNDDTTAIIEIAEESPTLPHCHKTMPHSIESHQNMVFCFNTLELGYDCILLGLTWYSSSAWIIFCNALIGLKILFSSSLFFLTTGVNNNDGTEKKKIEAYYLSKNVYTLFFKIIPGLALLEFNALLLILGITDGFVAFGQWTLGHISKTKSNQFH